MTEPAKIAPDLPSIEVPRVDLLASLRWHRVGFPDPGVLTGQDHYTVAFRLGGEPVVLSLRPRQRTEIAYALIGPPAVVQHLPAICGAHDDPEGLVALTATAPRLQGLVRRQRLVRLPRVPWLFEIALGTVLQQRVDFPSAAASYRELALRHGERAPGPERLQLVPTPERLSRLPSHAFREAGVDGQRERAVRALAEAAPELDALASLPGPAPAHARQVLERITGFGPWTVASILGYGLGDADAVPLGDYWLPHLVSNAMIGKARSDDREMEQLLEPYRPHRFRLVRVLYASGFDVQRFAPRRRGSAVR